MIKKKQKSSDKQLIENVPVSVSKENVPEEKKEQIDNTEQIQIQIQIPNKKEIPNFQQYKMFLTTIQASPIRTLSEALRDVLTDVNVHFDNTGIRIMSMDKTNTAFVHLKLNGEKFETYYCPKQFTIGLNMLSLHKLLKTINNSDIISLYILNDEHKLGIIIENKDKKIITKSKLHLLDLDNEIYSIPPINVDNIYEMPCSDFQKHCRDLLNIAEVVDVYTSVNENNENGFTLFANGDFADLEINIGENKHNIDIERPISIVENQNAIKIGTYDLKYLNLFCKSSSLCPMVQIYLKENYPFLLVFSVSSIGTLRFALSPKITLD